VRKVGEVWTREVIQEILCSLLSHKWGKDARKDKTRQRRLGVTDVTGHVTG
jgi:hypothetical protein